MADAKKKSISVNNIKIDPAESEATKDPLDIIRQGMADRGFETLWTSFNGPNRVDFDDNAKLAFLKSYAVTGRMAYSAAASGFSSVTINAHKRMDSVFAAAIEEAKAFFRDSITAELFRRGVEGFEEGVVGGRNKDQVIMVPKYSDKALELLARIHMPELQKESKGEEVKEVKPTVVNQFNFDKLSPENLELAKKLLENQAQAIEGEVIDGSDS